MRLMALTTLAALALSMLPAAPAPAADPLVRAASLGVAPGDPPAEVASALSGTPGLYVRLVVPGSNAERLGIRAGDVVLAVNGKPVAGAADVAAAGLRDGTPLRVEVWRARARLSLSGQAVGNPPERYEGAEVTYGAVPFRGGLLRDITVAPAGRPDAPVVFIIQGYDCGSMESPDPDQHYRRLTRGLLARGIATYRVEKPGVGDSRGTPACADIDLETEVAAFRAAYDKLTGTGRVPPSRVFLFGHSMGGIEAPLLVSALPRPPGGVAVFGTALRPWYDYIVGLMQFQGLMYRDEDPVAAARATAASREALRLFLLERKTPAEIVQADPGHAQGLRDSHGWEGGERLLGRHYAFWQQVANAPLVEAWRDTKAPVLVLHGASDIQAVNGEDHRLIADVVNHYRPGSACFVQFAGTDHGWNLTGDRATIRRQAREGTTPPGRPPVNPRVAEVLADWVQARLSGTPTTPGDGCAGIDLTAAETG